MKNRILILLILLLCFSLSVNFNNVFAEQSESNAKAMCVIEQTSKRILFEKNSHEKMPMASTTKIVTALTVLNNIKDSQLDKKIRIPDESVGIEGTSMYLEKNEELTIRDLLYGMLLPSGNDSAMALGIIVGGNENHFCEMMNQTARECGAFESNFANPHGLDEENHYTTAFDLALITSYALKNPTFEEIVTTKSIKIQGNERCPRYLKNKNKLLGTYDGCSGVKIGFTDKAGRCFVSSALRNNMSIVSVVLNCGPMFEECALFMNKAFEKYQNVELLTDFKFIKKVSVLNGKKDFVNVYVKDKFSYPMTLEEYVTTTIKYDIPDPLEAPIKKNEKVGKINVYMGDLLLFSEDVLAMDKVLSDNVLTNVKQIIEKW